MLKTIILCDENYIRDFIIFNFIYSFRIHYECKLSFRAERSIVWNFSFSTCSMTS